MTHTRVMKPRNPEVSNISETNFDSQFGMKKRIPQNYLQAIVQRFGCSVQEAQMTDLNCVTMSPDSVIPAVERDTQLEQSTLKAGRSLCYQEPFNTHYCIHLTFLTFRLTI